MKWRLLLIVPLLLLLSGCLSALQPERPANPPSKLTELKNQINPRVLWSAGIGGGTEEQLLKLAPAIYEGRVYLANAQGEVVARDARSGRTLWTAHTKSQASGGPGVGDGLVLIGTKKAEVIALSIANGEQRWRARVSSEVLSIPRVALGVVVVHTLDGNLTALDASSGQQKWAYNHPVPVLSLRGNSSPVISGSNVICGFANGKLTSLDLVTGNLNWEATVAVPSGRTELDRMIDIDADPLVTNEAVFVVTYQGDLAALSLKGGTVAWRKNLSSYAGLGGDWRQLFVTDAKDHVWAIDPSNSTALWKQDALQYRRLTAPTPIGDYVVAGDLEGYLHWMRAADGTLLARTRVGKAPITAQPQVVDGVLYVYGDGGEFSAISVSGAGSAAPADSASRNDKEAD